MEMIDESELESILIETRQCFLLEDAPRHIEILQQGLKELEQGSINYKLFMHGTHSLKGSAGIAKLSSLSNLAHQIEDLLQIVKDNRIPDISMIQKVLNLAIEEFSYVLSEAENLPANSLEDIPINPSIQQEVEQILLTLKSQANSNSESTLTPTSNDIPIWIKTALEEDLVSCLVQAQATILNRNSDLTEALIILIDECTLLGETLEISWLVDTLEPIKVALKTNKPRAELEKIAHQVIEELQRHRSYYLNPHKSLVKPAESKPIKKAETPISYFRIPLNRMEQMTNTLSELLIRYERLYRQQQEISKTNYNLRQLVYNLSPFQEQIETIYDQLATNKSYHRQDDDEFDPLEMDQYTEEHSKLQGFQELLLRIKESNSDLEISHRELSIEIDHLRQDLDQLYNDLTQSRLVPFKNLAHRFIPQLDRLGQRYDKKVKLDIIGEGILIDQIILEQLQTPLNHLLINAFDHGIELSSDRLNVGKSEQGNITITASSKGNQVTIVIEDDGRGIEINKLYQKGLDKGIIPVDDPTQWKREQILNLIFEPSFSTTNQVSELSGRGMGLDIVRSLITKLRGTIEVDTKQGFGTSFTLRLPLGLSLIALLICQNGNQLIALPSTDILDILMTHELSLIEGPHPYITWRDQEIPLFSCATLLPYHQLEYSTNKICLILASQKTPLAVTLDSILEERQLIVKPFDDLIVIPPYLAGCTILGSGKIVPVILPNQLDSLVNQSLKTKRDITKISLIQKTIPKILIAEDSISIRHLVERILKQNNYEVIACRDGQEALDELNRIQGKVNLIISDLEMPRVDGFRLLETIRTHDEWYRLPFIILTSRSGQRHINKAHSLGATGYLNKPVVPAELLQLIQSNLID